MGRTRGGLTGSRVAGALGRVPVEDVISHRAQQWSMWGFRTDSKVLTVASFVDKIYAVSNSLLGATRILDDFEKHLWERWSCKIKPESRACLVARGGEMSVSRPLWNPSRLMHVLGHIVSDDGTTTACMEQTFVQMWRAFFANCTSRDAKLVDPMRRMALMRRTAEPSLLYRCTRWPCRPNLESMLDQHQRRMVSLLLRLPRLPGEAVDVYCRRRGRASANHARAMGLWSLKHAERVVSWFDHLLRERNAESWPAMLLLWHGQEWLRECRLRMFSTSVDAGRTGTRGAAAKVAMRWHDGVTVAKQWIEDHR